MGWLCLWKRGRLYEGIQTEWEMNTFGGLHDHLSEWLMKHQEETNRGQTVAERKRQSYRQRKIKVIVAGQEMLIGYNFENGNGWLEADQHLENKKQRKTELQSEERCCWMQILSLLFLTKADEVVHIKLMVHYSQSQDSEPHNGNNTFITAPVVVTKNRKSLVLLRTYICNAV